MTRNAPAAPSHVCPGIRIHSIDILQPPGIGMSPIADMDVHQTVVSAALTAKSSADTPRKACCENRLKCMSARLSAEVAQPCRTYHGDATKGQSRYVPL